LRKTRTKAANFTPPVFEALYVQGRNVEPLEQAHEIYIFLKDLPIVGSFFSDNGPIVLGLIGIWLLWLIFSKVTPISRLLKEAKLDARGDLEESDLILLCSLTTRLRIYKAIIPLQSLLVVALCGYLLLFSSYLFKSLFLEVSEQKFSAVVTSLSISIICAWLINMQRLYIFQLARFIRANS